MDQHYVCTGSCGSVSDHPGTCSVADCTKHGQPMTLCDCTDGNHDEAHKKTDSDLRI